jgi:DNA repair exonuclease SbcCD nuclease subunit
MPKPEPVAVLISDVHYTLATLELADAAFRSAIDTAHKMSVPLIDCGDITNDKAILRAEVINKIIESLTYARGKGVKVYLIVGNHSLLHEKSREHSLVCLKPFVQVIDTPEFVELGGKRVMCIPYHHDSQSLSTLLDSLRPPRTIIMHQGVHGANMGHYAQDNTSLPKEAFAEFRVISGHYHRRQDIECGPVGEGQTGLFSYVGNPYTARLYEFT